MFGQWISFASMAILINICCWSVVVQAGKDGSTNIVLTKDTLILNDNGKKHSNNIVIKDDHPKHHHHCEHKVHLTHHHVHHMQHQHKEHHHHHHQPHHHQHHHDDDMHHRSDAHFDHDLHDLASHQQMQAIGSAEASQQAKLSGQRSAEWPDDEDSHASSYNSNDQHSSHGQPDESSPSSASAFLPGAGNSALNHILGLRYFRPLNVARSELQRTIKFPVFVQNDEQK